MIQLPFIGAREVNLIMFDRLNLDKPKFGLQNLRSGGATAAANACVSDRCFQKHGRPRWRTLKLLPCPNLSWLILDVEMTFESLPAL